MCIRADVVFLNPRLIGCAYLEMSFVWNLGSFDVHARRCRFFGTSAYLIVHTRRCDFERPRKFEVHTRRCRLSWVRRCTTLLHLPTLAFAKQPSSPLSNSPLPFAILSNSRTSTSPSFTTSPPVLKHRHRTARPSAQGWGTLLPIRR